MSRSIIVMFRSRNKDNKNIPDFHERTKVFLTDTFAYENLGEFQEFVAHGVPGEMSRMYISVNARDLEKTKKALIIQMISNDHFDLLNLNNELVSIAMRMQNRAQSRWLFDYDDSKDRIDEFVEDIICCTGEQPFSLQTPNGYAVIVDHGFDTRELMKKWGSTVSLKRDDFLCYHWKTNGESAQE